MTTTSKQHFDRAYDDSATVLTGDEPMLIVYDIFCVAFAVFERAGCPEDFCLQSCGGSTLVFGGRNRLLWSAAHGFRPDRSYCTESFLAACDEGNER